MAATEMSQVVARDSVAADHLVYPWPFPLGPSIELACAEGEVAVVCPAWSVGANLGPGRHTWQSPEPTKPTAVYFVLTGPVEVPFDMVTQFPMPATGQAVMVRATGSVLVRVADPALLVAQFVGLPFDRINDGLMFSVSTSVERLLAKVLPRKAALAGTAAAIADPAGWPALLEELAQYNPTAGAVYGVGFVRFQQVQILVGDHNGWSPAQAWQHDPSESTERGAVPSNPALVPPAVPVPELPVGTRVLVALADGLFHSATVRQALQGYYELDVGDTGETVWVPMGQVAPQV